MKKCFIGFLLLLMTSPLFMKGKEHVAYAQRPGTRFATTKALQDTATAIDARSAALWLSLVDSLKVAKQIWSAADTLGWKAALGAPATGSWYVTNDGADNPIMYFVASDGDIMSITPNTSDELSFAGAAKVTFSADAEVTSTLTYTTAIADTTHHGVVTDGSTMYYDTTLNALVFKGW